MFVVDGHYLCCDGTGQHTTVPVVLQSSELGRTRTVCFEQRELPEKH